MNRSTILIALLLQCLFAGAQVPRVSAGRIERIDSFRSSFVDTRNIDVWLPSGYPSAGRYDVLYMHDGQMLFDSSITWNKQEWKADETASRLIAEQRTRPFIIVGIPSISRIRLAEYFPERAANLLGKADRDSLIKEVGGRLLADEYLSFLVTELKPHIDSVFATNPKKEHTFIAGSSMGGLISLYALCRYPRTFGGAACISTHWPGSFRGLSDGGKQFTAIMHFTDKNLPVVRSRHLLYMDRGDKTLDSFYLKLQPQIDSLLATKGYTLRVFRSRLFPGADHSEKSWAARLDEPFLFLFGTKKK